ncbi:DinB family protein [Pontibacter sp. KCTC 32443]|uniref:DinB family protein n=1 Tax=Pontibacter TaxID=323449 RepID=UPI00164E73FB|nr:MULTISPECIES: DinB family protein [Pontibacter]MBC5775840.1 DinB family protein [Pontibacter sp. KCTC 32443]
MTTLDQLSQTISSLAQVVTAEFSTIDSSALNYKPAPESWSILECLEHLNRYSRYYNPVLAKAIANNSDGNYVPSITYSWLGIKSLDMVRPQNGKKHKTVKHMNPANSQLSQATIDEFLKHQQELQQLILRAKSANLNKKAVPVEFFKLLKLRIGETLEFVVTHQERHVQQALRVKQELSSKAAA